MNLPGELGRESLSGFQADAVYFMMWGGWKTELRSNRWHFARQWSRYLPVIMLHFIGAGKIVFHATDETHRWRFRVGDVYFARYWVQTIRYLARSKLLSGSRTVEITTDREQYRRGDDVVMRVRFLDDRLAPPADDGVMVNLEAESAQRRPNALPPTRTTGCRTSPPRPCRS